MGNAPRWRFGPFDADAAEHRLRHDGVPVPLTPRAFALLARLLHRPGTLVTKSELFESVWARRVVTDAALSRAIRELRVALGDDAATPRYIATVHGLGFRFVGEVAAEPSLPVAAATGPSPLAEARIVGRERDLGQLEQAFADARAGRRRTVFVTGEAGIGKTTLVEAFLRRHAGDGTVWAVQGRCIEQYGTGEAYLPILEALEHLARTVGADRMREVLLRNAPAWLAQLPWLAHDADAESMRRASEEGSAQRMLREIAQALEVLAAERPVVLWLEDLHWSDPSSLAVIAFLAGRRDPARLLLIASFRPADTTDGAAALQGLALQLAQRGQASPLSLGLLDEAAIAGYLRARFGIAMQLPLPALAAFLHRRTDGNALFTVAMVDDLVRRGRLIQLDGAWALHGSVAELGDGLPDDLRHLVHEQVERLAADDRRLVEAAAVAGTDFAAAHVAAALEADIAGIEDRCDRLARQGRFLRTRESAAWPDGTVSAGFGFLHALYWQAIHERVPHGRRTEWQRRIGIAEERAYEGQCGLIASELAMRFEAAKDTERCLRYLAMAGDAALSRCAYEEGIALLRRALALVPLLPEAERREREIELLLPLGAASMAARGYASAEVASAYERALALCPAGSRPGDLERVLRGLWNVAFLRADLARARTIAEQLLERATANDDVRLAADAHTKLGQTCIHQGDLAPARHHLEAALAAAQGDAAVGRREAPRVAIYLAWVLWYSGRTAEALERADEAIRTAEEVGSPHSSAFALGYAAQLHYLCGDLEREVQRARQLASLSVEHGLAFWRSLAEFTLGRVEAQQGRSEEGIARMETAIADMRAAGGLVGVPYLFCLLGEAELASGRLDEARASLAEASAVIASTGNSLHAAEALRLQGELALAEGAPTANDDAEIAFLAACELARRQGAGALELRATFRLARLWSSLGQASRAVAVLRPLVDAVDAHAETADLGAARALLASLRS